MLKVALTVRQGAIFRRPVRDPSLPVPYVLLQSEHSLVYCKQIQSTFLQMLQSRYSKSVKSTLPELSSYNELTGFLKTTASLSIIIYFDISTEIFV